MIKGREKILASLRKFFPQRLINYFYHLPIAALAALYYQFPGKKLKIIGITGTDGKTTTASIIYEILIAAGKKAALITTLGANFNEQTFDTGLHVTSPKPMYLQRLMAKMVKKKIEYLVLEVTSHGLDQFRFFGCSFYLSVLTNISKNEHLDYHKTFPAYLKAKAILFKNSKYSILNIEDPSYSFLKNQVKGKITTYGLNKGDINLKSFPFQTQLLGQFNRLNCLAAITVAKFFGIKNKIIRNTLANFKNVTGRLEEIKMGQEFRVFIDFAHTPNGLKNVLLTLNQLTHKRLIVVFGCAGLRDKTKRPLMGKIACQLADKVVITSEDPRTENAKQILKEILKGCQNKSKVSQVLFREEAINQVIEKICQKGDLVVFCGKGHERSICVGEREIPWSEHQMVKKALQKRINS